MSKTFEQGKDEIAGLCGYFAKNRAAFCAPGRKEAHVRQDLIDPLFRALGWDVGNAARVAPQYCEVVVEDSLDVEGQQKAPDYTFRVGTLPKFYTEAKKCGVNIFADPAPAYQLRRYGWSAKVAVSILTDFEEMGVYDCTLRPRPSDKASHARILYYRFDEYPDRWRELWDIFSREAVWTGAFDQYAASKRKRGTSEVDVEFLKEIEGWRDELARNIALRNRNLSGDELNRAVQLTIDRVVFLRMAEDRGLEPYEQLLSLCGEGDIYEGYMKLSRKADDKYNSGLFHFQKEPGVSEAPDEITPRLAVDDKVFKPIIQSLYFEHGSPYHFGVLPVEILGTVYERFLGKVIRLTAGHQAKIEEKPEVRKAGGVYYTPKYIVDYIVRQTVAHQIEGKSPAQLAGKGKARVAGILPARAAGVSPADSNARGQDGLATRGRDPCGQAARDTFRVLDMACGSGSFLLGAYQCLLDHCLKWYIDNGPEGFPKAVCLARRSDLSGRSAAKPEAEPAALPDWRLTIGEKKRILLSHVFGVDIDPQAVEVSKLSLLLKVLEGESAETIGDTMRLFHERALPNPCDNIKCGNSLIGPDYFTGKLMFPSPSGRGQGEGVLPEAEEFARVNAFDWKREFPAAFPSPSPSGRGQGEGGGFDCVIGNPPWGQKHIDDEVSVKTYIHAHYPSTTGIYDLFRPFVEKAIRLTTSNGFWGMVLPDIVLLKDYPDTRLFLLDNVTLTRIDWWGMAFHGAVIDAATLIGQKARARPSHKVHVTVRDKGTPAEHDLSQEGFRNNRRHTFNLHLTEQLRAALDALLDKPTLGDFFEIHEGIHSGNMREALFVNSRMDSSCRELLFGRDEIRPYVLQWRGRFVRLNAVPKTRSKTRYANIGRREWYERDKILVRRTGDYILAAVERAHRYASNNFFVVIPKSETTPPLDAVAAVLNSRFMTWFFRAVEPRKGRAFAEVKIKHLRTFPLPNPADKSKEYRELSELSKRRAAIAEALCKGGPGRNDAMLAKQADYLDREIDANVLKALEAPESCLVTVTHTP